MKVKFLLIALVALFFACEKSSDSVSEKINAEGVLRSDVSFVKWNQMQDDFVFRLNKAIEHPDFLSTLKRLSETQNESDLVYVINALGYTKREYEIFYAERLKLMKELDSKYAISLSVFEQELTAYNASNQASFHETREECYSEQEFEMDLCTWNPGLGIGFSGWLNDFVCSYRYGVGIDVCNAWYRFR